MRRMSKLLAGIFIITIIFPALCVFGYSIAAYYDAEYKQEQKQIKLERIEKQNKCILEMQALLYSLPSYRHEWGKIEGICNKIIDKN